MEIIVSNRAERPMNEAEIAVEEEAAKRIRADKGLFVRLLYWNMDRAYIASLKKGRTMTEAHEDASARHGFLFGVLAGAAFTLLVVGLAGYLWGVVQTSGWIVAGLIVVVWVLFIGGFAQKGLKRLVGWIKSKRKKKDTE